MPGCEWVCPGMCGCAQVYTSVRKCVWVCTDVHKVCAGVCGNAGVCAWVWDEFSESLLENRVNTSADFNIYPIRIFLVDFYMKRPSEL